MTRPGFIAGIKALKAKQGIADYDPNRDATRQEMRAFVCGQCHVEYYFKGDGKVVTYPWANGLKVEEIEAYYDKEGFTDWVHAETGTKMLKAQHPEFEVWNQGIHARAGVACADCHMPYERVGALKVSDHWVRSPLLNINRACQPCHAVPEKELESRVLTIQDRHHELLQRAAKATTDLLDAMGAAQKAVRRTPSCRRRTRCIARPSGGSTSSPPRTPWGSTRPRSWRGSWARRSTSRARASSRPTAPPGRNERGTACGPPRWSGSGAPPGLRRNRLTGKIEAVRAPSRIRPSVVLPTALERNAAR